MRRLECTVGGLENFDLEGTAAPHQREFVKKYAPTWCLLRGGEELQWSHGTASTSTTGPSGILLFRSG